MKVRNITPHVSFCGINDREKPTFDNLYELPTGVSYNSYMVSGPDATALIEGCDANHATTYIEGIGAYLGDKEPDYLVVDHAEPDHTGALPMMRLRWPNMKIVGNAKTLDLLKGYYGLTAGLVEVKEGSTLSLGGETVLEFLMTPMLHWPETMMTYYAEDGILFTGDAFGCFGALDGAVVDDEMDDPERYFTEAERYYACIIAKYGSFVEKAVAKIRPLKIERLCTTHGPVWHTRMQDIINLYLRMARWDAEKGVVVVYGSMYGSTTAMTEELTSRLVAEGVRQIRVHEVTRTPLSVILAEVMRFDSIVLVSPTYNTEIYPPMEALARALVERSTKRRKIALMGSYSWGGQSVRKLKEVLQPLKECTLLDPTPEMKQAIIEQPQRAIALLARELR